jgi:hypothetical protein
VARLLDPGVERERGGRAGIGRFEVPQNVVLLAVAALNRGPQRPASSDAFKLGNPVGDRLCHRCEFAWIDGIGGDVARFGPERSSPVLWSGPTTSLDVLPEPLITSRSRNVWRATQLFGLTRASMPGVRSALNLIALAGGVGSVVIGLVTFLGNHSWNEFLFRVGIGYLILAAITAMVIAGRRAAPPPAAAPGDVAPKMSSNLDIGAVYMFAMGSSGVYAALVVLLSLLGGTDARGVVEAIGAIALMILPISIAVSWSDIVVSVREVSQAKRPCPRCGHPVPAGRMACPHCDFDFHTIGA